MMRETTRPARRILAAVSSAAFGAVLVASTVTASSASWTDTEWDRTALESLDCAAPGSMDARAWGRVLTGALGSVQLDPILAIDGVSVSNLAPATSSAATSHAAPLTDLGGDAWSGALGLSVLSSLSLGAGLVLPLDAGTGTYTQYGRATSAGEQIGASGAVTTQAGGLASLTTPDAGTPRLGTLRLSTVLDAILPGLGVAVGSLSDVDLTVGAVGAIAELDACAVAWNPAALATELDREYLVAGLDLGYTSDLVSGLGTGLATTLTGLQSSLNTLLTAQVSASAISSLTSYLGTSLGGIADVGLGSDPVTVTVSGAVNLAPVSALLTNDITDGVVTVNLASGRVSADLAALLGQNYADSDGLNGRDPNTSVLQPGVINALLTRISTLLTNFVTNTIQPAIAKAILDTSVSVTIAAHLDATVSVLGLGLTTLPNALSLTIGVSGTIGGFTGAAGYAAPTNSSSLTVFGSYGGLVITALNALLGLVTGSIVTAVTSGVVPYVGSIVVQPILVSLSASVTSTLATVVGTTIPALITALRPVLEVLATVLRITLNAQPDQPDGVGSPAATAPGRYFESALHVGVVNGSTSLLSLWAASASVGPAAKR